MSGYTFRTTKDVAETIPYAIDWTAQLNATEPPDVVNASEWRVEAAEDPVGLTIVSTDNTSTVTSVMVTGGNRTQRYRLINKITTFGGMVLERTILVECKVK